MKASEAAITSILNSEHRLFPSSAAKSGLRPISLLLIFLFTIASSPATEREDSISSVADTISYAHLSLLPDSPIVREALPYRHIVTPPIRPDSADIRFKNEKHFWRAAAETVGFNIGLWAFDRYVLKGHYAYISWNSIKENFRHGFEWDNDHLQTNMFSHPYNGSIFYNAGRSNGYNFWQSELFAISGSAMWELFMECEYPSTNDIIATPIGGAALGEVFYRTSDLILDDRATGGERFGREFLSFLVNPMRGLNRIFSGAAWKRRTTSGRRFGIPPISVEVSLGARMLTGLYDNCRTRIGPAAEINIEYGQRYEERSNAPYDYFSFLMEVQTIRDQPLLSRIEIMGRLLGREIVDAKRLHVNVGLYQHFDFLDSDTIGPGKADKLHPFLPAAVPYKLGIPACIGGGLMAKFTPNPKMSLDGYFHANSLILAGVLTDFYRKYHRNYNWGSGFALKAGINWALADGRLLVQVADQAYRVYTWMNKYDSELGSELMVNVQGDKSRAWFNHFETSVSYRLWNNLFLTAGLDLYHRRTNYTDTLVKVYDDFGQPTSWTYQPQIDSNQLGIHFMLTYRF